MSATSPQPAPNRIAVYVRVRNVPEITVQTAAGRSRRATIALGGAKLRRNSTDSHLFRKGQHQQQTASPQPSSARTTPRSASANNPPRTTRKDLHRGDVGNKVAVSMSGDCVSVHDVSDDSTSERSIMFRGQYDGCFSSLSQLSALEMPNMLADNLARPFPRAGQEDVYAATGSKAVDALMNGVNSCVFAYGQTGSGKTYTLIGDSSCIHNEPGLIPRACEDLFSRLRERLERQQQLHHDGGLNDEDADELPTSVVDVTYDVSVSFVEIYQRKVSCLLGDKHQDLSVKERRDGSVFVDGAVVKQVSNAKETLALLERGLRKRQTAETSMNARSSRSHAIFQVTLKQYRSDRQTREVVQVTSTMNLVDLAGSERLTESKNESLSANEGANINLSLLHLGRVINDCAAASLASRGSSAAPKRFINYRDSKLTHLLKENIGGNSVTFMVANISPMSICSQESCATLQYAKNVRNIKMTPQQNTKFQTKQDVQEVLRKLLSDNERLREEMQTLTNNHKMSKKEEFQHTHHHQHLHHQSGHDDAVSVSPATAEEGLSRVGQQETKGGGEEEEFATSPLLKRSTAATGNIKFSCPSSSSHGASAVFLSTSTTQGEIDDTGDITISTFQNVDSTVSEVDRAVLMRLRTNVDTDANGCDEHCSQQLFLSCDRVQPRECCTSFWLTLTQHGGSSSSSLPHQMNTDSNVTTPSSASTTENTSVYHNGQLLDLTTHVSMMMRSGADEYDDGAGNHHDEIATNAAINLVRLHHGDVISVVDEKSDRGATTRFHFVDLMATASPILMTSAAAMRNSSFNGSTSLPTSPQKSSAATRFSSHHHNSKTLLSNQNQPLATATMKLVPSSPSSSSSSAAAQNMSFSGTSAASLSGSPTRMMQYRRSGTNDQRMMEKQSSSEYLISEEAYEDLRKKFEDAEKQITKLQAIVTSQELTIEFQCEQAMQQHNGNHTNNNGGGAVSQPRCSTTRSRSRAKSTETEDMIPDASSVSITDLPSTFHNTTGVPVS